MFTLHRPPTVIPAFVAVLMFFLSAPLAVHAEDQILADQPVLAAESQVPALAPVADSSWDELSGYGSVEASRAAITSLPDTLAAALASGTRPESAHLATVPLPGAAVRVNPSDDRIANALFGDPLPVPVPRLTDVSAITETPRLFTVTGQGFTAGGRVYLAIYDQMGVQLFETRWITASPPLLAVAGPTGHEAASLNGYGHRGTLREASTNLCGATAMMRAYDEATTTWSTWLTVEPTCAAYVEPHSGPR